MVTLSRDLAGLRLVVVGASSGIGRATALAASAHGARVVFMGRDGLQLAAAIADASTQAFAVACDVRDPASCESAIARARTLLGGADAMVYTPATLQMGLLRDVSAQEWSASLWTNVIGAALVSNAIMPHLRESVGRAVYMSSDVADFPRSGLGLYGVSKRALEGLCIQLRIEEPNVRFTSINLGPTRPTGLGRDSSIDQAKKAEITQRWSKEGINYRGEAHNDDVAAIVLQVLTSTARIDQIVVAPPEGGPQ